MSEEIELRQSFFAEHGANLPEDLCTCVANMPTRWEVGPAPGEIREELPTIDKDLLDEVRVSVLFSAFLVHTHSPPKASRRLDLVKDGTESV